MSSGNLIKLVIHCAVNLVEVSVDVVERRTANIPMEVVNLVSLNSIVSEKNVELIV